MPDHWSDSAQVIHLLAGRWTLTVLGELAEGGRRHQDLLAGLGSISHKVLTDTLRRTERDGLVIRDVDRSRTGTATVYQLTDLARSLEAPLGEIACWATRSWTAVETARRNWNIRTDVYES